MGNENHVSIGNADDGPDHDGKLDKSSNDNANMVGNGAAAAEVASEDIDVDILYMRLKALQSMKEKLDQEDDEMVEEMEELLQEADQAANEINEIIEDSDDYSDYVPTSPLPMQINDVDEAGLDLMMRTSLSENTSGGPISGFDGATSGGNGGPISGSVGSTSGGNGRFHNINSSKDEAIVTCTVTTGLTTNQFNGYNNGTSGSILGFTLSIPSTSLSGSNDSSNNPNPEGIGRTGNGSFSNSAPLSSPTFTGSRQHQQLKKSNGLSSSVAKNSGALFGGLTEKIVPAKNNKKIHEPFPVPALVIQDSTNEKQKQNNTVQDEVDEDYDDF